jgi:hypothetical protein
LHKFLKERLSANEGLCRERRWDDREQFALYLASGLNWSGLDDCSDPLHPSRKLRERNRRIDNDYESSLNLSGNEAKMSFI